MALPSSRIGARARARGLEWGTAARLAKPAGPVNGKQEQRFLTIVTVTITVDKSAAKTVGLFEIVETKGRREMAFTRPQLERDTQDLVSVAQIITQQRFTSTKPKIADVVRMIDLAQGLLKLETFNNIEDVAIRELCVRLEILPDTEAHGFVGMR